ncbi:MAG TPA: Hint domain-containing protein, partial [Gemmatimonadaceae bacterium]|nr:Hint domain-containing protein [Gemmatimonadaceae bacterium]
LGWSTRDDAAPATHRVCALHRGRTRTVMRIGVHGTSIHCTRAHLFHLPSRGWVPAMELRVGDALTDSGTGSPIVEEVERLTLAGDTDTFDLTVDGVSTYFVRAGTSWVLVHNGGPGDFGGPLYWIFGKKPNLRPGDVDGLSSFKTTSVAEVEILMDHRVNVSGRPVGDPHFCLTEAEVQSAGLVAPQTPSVDPLAAKLPHHSLRPAEAPAYPHELTPPEMTQLGTKLNTLPRTIIKPSQIRC